MRSRCLSDLESTIITAVQRARSRACGAAIILALVVAYCDGSAQGARLAECDPGKFEIAIDVGHTPETPGATSARGVTELYYNTMLANQIKVTLVDGGFRVVLITTDGIGMVQLLQRAERANLAKVDLLLSIHHDDVQSVYHSTWMYNGALHTFSDKYSGYSLFVSRSNFHFNESLMFAKLLGTSLKTRGMHYSAHHAEHLPGENRQLIDTSAGVYLYDQLVVLKFTRAPAVLLEAGVIVNRIEEVVLASSEGRATVSAAVLDAVQKFCALGLGKTAAPKLGRSSE
jgi:N-acetylmuramoyl-L-alanine amidase